MEVVLVHPADPVAPAQGGAIRFSLNLLHHLVERGVDVTFLGVDSGEKSHRGLPYRFIPVLRGTHDWRLFFAKLMVMAPALRLQSSTIVQAFRLDYILPFVLFQPRNPKVMVSDEPLHYARIAYKPIFPIVAAAHRFVEAFCMRRLDAVITDDRTASHYRAAYPRLMRNRLFVLPHSSVDAGKFRPMDRAVARAALGVDADAAVVAFVGRLEKVKDLDFLLRAFACFQADASNAQLLIVGRGSEDDRLKAIVQASGLPGVRFMGEYPPDKVPEVINAADMLALCSRTEGSPTVVREALACGVPVVSTDVGDVASILTDHRLGRVAPKQERGFAAAMLSTLQIVRRETDVVRDECVRTAGAFTSDKVAEPVMRLYQGFVRRRHLQEVR